MITSTYFESHYMKKKIVPFDKNLNINETKNFKKIILIVFNWRKYEIYNSIDRFL